MLERHYGWDTAGNQVTRVDQLRGTHAFRYDPTGRVIDYDTHGNVTRRRKGAHELAELSWNAEHQLAQSTVTRHGVTQTTGVRQSRSQAIVFYRAHFQKCHYNSANCSGAAGFSIPNA
ncbi:hypothetical protein [Parazoarcus communis]|uniref:hypothetical protein n=1 Tax=Parazoarcus communis TaxID=41977 RepID=UPI0010580F4C|nr:hypothetical protein [Parazoarcus communis]NMG72929.1 hypothetical protein [Parazoarcus communis SWub3 = DSM 12120]